MIKLKNLFFEPYLTEKVILKRVKELAASINNDYQTKNPIFLAVLNGSFMFMSDICKEISVEMSVSFIKVASYSGNSMAHLLEMINKEQPSSVELVSLLFKPDALVKPIKIKYVGFEIPDLFVVGYGLDYQGQGRNLRDIYQIVENN